MDNNFLDVLMHQFSGSAVDMLGSQLGIENQQAKLAMSQFLPIIVKALAGNASQSQGAESLHNALQRDHSGSILENLTGAISKPNVQDGGGILGHVFGGQMSAVTDFISKNTGLQPESVNRMMKTAAPIILGMLGKQLASNRMSADDLSGYLQQSSRDVQRTDPRNMGMIGQLLDADNDGDIMDDVASMGMTFLQNWMNGRNVSM